MMEIPGLLACLLTGIWPFVLLAKEHPPMRLFSPDFTPGGMIPPPFTCDGANTNPELDIADVPRQAVSLVLIMDDPDAPGGTWNHWLLWNIDPATAKIAEDSVPAGAVQGRSDFGSAKYLGPSPPKGIHRYFFRLLALDTKLNLPPDSDRAALDQSIRGHVISTAELMGRYQRSR